MPPSCPAQATPFLPLDRLLLPDESGSLNTPLLIPEVSKAWTCTSQRAASEKLNLLNLSPDLSEKRISPSGTSAIILVIEEVSSIGTPVASTFFRSGICMNGCSWSKRSKRSCHLIRYASIASIGSSEASHSRPQNSAGPTSSSKSSIMGEIARCRMASNRRRIAKSSVGRSFARHLSRGA